MASATGTAQFKGGEVKVKPLLGSSVLRQLAQDVGRLGMCNFLSTRHNKKYVECVCSDLIGVCFGRGWEFRVLTEMVWNIGGEFN